MREIDPIRNPSDALLSAALHRLTSGSPQNAPAELGASLAREFRRRHARRRQARIAIIASMAACLVLVAALLMSQRHADRKTAPQVARQETPADTKAPPQVTRPENATQLNHTRPVKTGSSADDNDFLALNTYDPATNSGNFEVVRLELSGSELRMIGAPVTEDMADRHLLADVVVGEDGTPYAVRLVR